MKFRLYNKNAKDFTRDCQDKIVSFDLVLWAQFAAANRLENLDSYTVQYSMGVNDKNGREIYEGDIVTVECKDGSKNKFIVRFGKAERTMGTGAAVEIHGFYFESDLVNMWGDDWEKMPRFSRFSIIKNWKNCHDLEITEVVGYKVE